MKTSFVAEEGNNNNQSIATTRVISYIFTRLLIAKFLLRVISQVSIITSSPPPRESRLMRFTSVYRKLGSKRYCLLSPTCEGRPCPSLKTSSPTHSPPGQPVRGWGGGVLQGYSLQPSLVFVLLNLAAITGSPTSGSLASVFVPFIMLMQVLGCRESLSDGIRYFFVLLFFSVSCFLNSASYSHWMPGRSRRLPDASRKLRLIPRCKKESPYNIT